MVRCLVYFFFPGSMALSLSIRLGLAVGLLDAGLAGRAAMDGEVAGDVAGEAGLTAGCVFGGLEPFSAGVGVFASPGNGVDPFTTPAAENSGTFSSSFLTRIEMRRLEGSVGLLFTRSIWSA